MNAAQATHLAPALFFFERKECLEVCICVVCSLFGGWRFPECFLREEQPVKGLLFFVQSRPIIKGCESGVVSHKQKGKCVLQLALC